MRRLLVPRLADWCALHLVRGDRLETTAVWHRDPGIRDAAQGEPDAYPVDLTAADVVASVVRTGQAELHTHLNEQMLRALASDDAHVELLLGLGLTSAVVAPLRRGGEVIGALSLVYADSGRRHDEDDVPLLADLASRIGPALVNAESYTRQSRRLTEVMKVGGRSPAGDPGPAGTAGRALRPVGSLRQRRPRRRRSVGTSTRSWR